MISTHHSSFHNVKEIRIVCLNAERHNDLRFLGVPEMVNVILMSHTSELQSVDTLFVGYIVGSNVGINVGSIVGSSVGSDVISLGVVTEYVAIVFQI